MKTKTTNRSTNAINKTINDDFDKIYLGAPLEQYYLVPYAFSKLTLFMFVKGNKTKARSI